MKIKKPNAKNMSMPIRKGKTHTPKKHLTGYLTVLVNRELPIRTVTYVCSRLFHLWHQIGKNYKVRNNKNAGSRSKPQPAPGNNVAELNEITFMPRESADVGRGKTQ